MRQLPAWFRQPLPDMDFMNSRLDSLRQAGLHTVCTEARCPNIFDCFGRNTATFMILGDVCTRRCRFCCVKQGAPAVINGSEPRRIAEAIVRLGLRYAVITSVTRDDLFDGGAEQFSKTVRAIKEQSPATKVEVLIPDFQGEAYALERVADSGADVIAHNMETVSRLYPVVRPQADYRLSLKVLKSVKDIRPDLLTKSGCMVGLGERDDELIRLFGDLRSVSCDMLAIGQYLAPSAAHAAVERFVTPQDFERLRLQAFSLGFKSVASAPLVRSSFHSEELFEKCMMS